MLAGRHLSQLTIRQAHRSDIDAIVNVTNRAFAVERFFSPVDRTSRDRIEALFGSGTLLVAEDHGQIAGSVYVEPRGSAVYIGLLAVDPSWQGCGLGRLLMDASERFGAAAGCTTAELTVVNLRTELPPFYRKLGYRETGTRPFDRDLPVAPTCHFILMSKPLSPA
jgi:predicted N-acetyltransferase YhbS